MPRRFKTKDPETGQTIRFSWDSDAEPTQQDLANIVQQEKMKVANPTPIPEAISTREQFEVRDPTPKPRLDLGTPTGFGEDNSMRGYLKDAKIEPGTSDWGHRLGGFWKGAKGLVMSAPLSQQIKYGVDEGKEFLDDPWNYELPSVGEHLDKAVGPYLRTALGIATLPKTILDKTTDAFGLRAGTVPNPEAQGELAFDALTTLAPGPKGLKNAGKGLGGPKGSVVWDAGLPHTVVEPRAASGPSNPLMVDMPSTAGYLPEVGMPTDLPPMPKVELPGGSPELAAALKEAEATTRLPPEVQTLLDQLEKPKEGYTRMYRREGPLSKENGGWFQTDPAGAYHYNDAQGAFKYTDVPQKLIEARARERGMEPSAINEMTPEELGNFPNLAKEINLGQKPTIPEPLTVHDPTAPRTPPPLNGPPPPKGQNPASSSSGGKTGAPMDFFDWVTHRDAASLEGEAARQSFADLPQGIQFQLDFQEGKADAAQSARVRQFLDQLFAEEQAAGVKYKKKRNYLTQIWKEDPGTVRQTFKSMGVRPSFSMQTLFDSLRKGMDAGLTPKYENISDLLGVRKESSAKAIANRRFFDTLKNEGKALPPRKAPQDFVESPYTQFPKARTKRPDLATTGPTGEIEVPSEITPYMLEPEVARKIRNYLGERTPTKVQKALQTTAEVSRVSKNVALSAGVPKTGINMQGVNTMARRTLAEGFKTIPETLKYLVNPKSAKKGAPTIEQSIEAIKDGLTFSTAKHRTEVEGGFSDSKGFSGILGENPITKGLDKGALKLEEWFENPLKNEVMPTIKYQYYKRLKEQGMSGREAAQTANEFFGGVNRKALGRSRDFNDMMQSIFLAPDLLETNVKVGKGMAQSLFDGKTPRGQAYREATGNLVKAYVAATLLNKLSSGHWMHENDSGHQLSISIGQDSKGRTRYVAPFGTSAEFARIPLSVATALVEEQNAGKAAQTVKNKFSGPLQTVMNLLTNNDYKGDPLYGRDKYGREQDLSKQLANIGLEVADPFTPQFVDAPIDFLRGRTSGEQALLSSVEMPVQYAYERDDKAPDKRKQKGRKARSRSARH